MSSPTQYRSYQRRFYRSEDPTNSVSALKKYSWPSINPTGPSNNVTCEPPKNTNPITTGRAQRDEAPHSRPAYEKGQPVKVLYRLYNNKCYATLSHTRLVNTVPCLHQSNIIYQMWLWWRGWQFNIMHSLVQGLWPYKYF